MLRDDGVVKVLDFGVARSLKQPGATPADGDGESTVGSGEPTESPVGSGEPPEPELTFVGQTVGTVLTMSPEQARGERVTAATDLYSLGLVFQELFTGRAPHPPDLSPEMLWLRAREAETLPVEGLDRELTALIEELKRLDPSLRPTAAQTARRLRAIRPTAVETDQQMEWAREA